VQLANASLEKSPNNIDALVVLATERIAAGDAVKAVEDIYLHLKAS
jgi:cytochrome c-type biogenesis protein CcmH/NrfG